MKQQKRRVIIEEEAMQIEEPINEGENIVSIENYADFMEDLSQISDCFNRIVIF